MGFGIQEGLMMRNAMLDMKDRRAESQFEDQYKKHLGGIQADPENYNPGPGYDPKAFNQARYAYTQNQLNDQKVQKGVFEHKREIIDQQYANTKSFIDQAAAAAIIHDVDSEFSAYEKAYENTFDGNDIKFSKDYKSYTITNRLTGQTNTRAYSTVKEMQGDLRAMTERMGHSREYTQKVLESQADMARLNAQQSFTPQKNDKGQIGYVVHQWNHETNQVEKNYEVEGIRMPVETFRKMGFMSAADRKTHAEADKLRADARATAKGKKGTTAKRTTGSMEKDADAYVRAYDKKGRRVSFEQAMDMVRLERANSKMHEEMTEFKSENMITTGDETDEELEMIRAKREELLLKYKPVPPPTKKARGLPKGKEAKVPTDNLPSPKGLEEGQTAGKGQYVIKNGEWTIAE
ncbi:hypothetical protein KAR91_65585 [Candidatus Pacearchaeota archaeon]|nr:hypothetical protein [Candidatus Pacearchaeota archaeon]